MEKTHDTGSNRGFTVSEHTISGTSSEVTQRSEVLTGNDDTGSKKLLKTDNQLHSSTIAVLGDDLLIQILLRLPVLSLRLFKSVSKYWLSFIKLHYFTLSRKKIPKIDPPAGLLIFRVTYDGKMYQIGYDFESFDILVPSKRSIVFTAGSDAPPDFVRILQSSRSIASTAGSDDAPPGFVRILQSCNGLLLCSIVPDMLYGCNPTLKQFNMLPANSPVHNVKIAFDPTKSLHYKVIHAKFVHHPDNGDVEFPYGYYQIETYSSETRNWSLCVDRFPKHSFTQFGSAIYWNDALHWIITRYAVCSYCNLKIVNEPPVLTQTGLPGNFEGKLLESGGSLLRLSMDDTTSQNRLSRDDSTSQKLNVFEMKKGCSEWSLKYSVHLDDIMMPFPETWWIGRHVWAIVLGEREEDSFMVFNLSSKVVQYNPKLRTLRTLYDLEPTRSLHTRSEAYLFIPSFAGV